MHKLHGLAVMTLALLPLTAVSASAQTQFASFTGGLFKFTNSGASSTFDGSGNVASLASFTDDQHNVTYSNITISLTSSVTGGGAQHIAGNQYVQGLDNVSLMFTDNVTGKNLLTATGNANLVGFVGTTGAQFNGDNSLVLSDVVYSSSVLTVDNTTNNNQYGTTLTLVSSTKIALPNNGNGYFTTFNANGTGTFDTAVPEASTLLGFGMLLGGGLLGLRKKRSIKAA